MDGSWKEQGTSRMPATNISGRTGEKQPHCGDYRRSSVLVGDGGFSKSKKCRVIQRRS